MLCFFRKCSPNSQKSEMQGPCHRLYLSVDLIDAHKRFPAEIFRVECKELAIC